MSEAVWIVAGETPAGVDVRLFGPTLTEPMRFKAPSRKMVAIGCDRCGRRHSSANTACAATFRVRVRRRRGTLYNARTGVAVAGRYKVVINPATGLATAKRRP